MASLTRKFNGKIYKYYGAYNNKTTVNNITKRFKAKGKLVRAIQTVRGVWTVYVR